MKITIFGAGFVGLSTAVCLAKKHDITLIDVDEKKIDSINNNRSYIFEKGLDDLLSQSLENKRLVAKHITDRFHPMDLIMIAVGTPSEEDGYINLSYLKSVINTIDDRRNEFLRDDGKTIIMIKSTVVPGSTNRLLRHFEQQKSALIAFCPEFLAQGKAIEDTLNPSRIIIGTNNKIAQDSLVNFFRDFYDGQDVKILTMTIESAEFTKYASNVFLAMKISFANEMADLVEKVSNADITDVMDGIGLDPRISPKFLRAGIGFGGSCFPKDLRALIRFSEEISAETPALLSATLKVNENRPFRLIKILRKQLGNLDGKKVAILGLTFKPGTNDMREAPSIRIIQALWRAGVKVKVHDPLLPRIDMSPIKKFEIETYDDVTDCLKDTDACLIITEWPQYKELDMSIFTENMRRKLIIDGRRIFVNRNIPSDVKYITIGNSNNRSPPINNN